MLAKNKEKIGDIAEYLLEQSIDPDNYPFDNDADLYDCNIEKRNTYKEWEADMDG